MDRSKHVQRPLVFLCALCFFRHPLYATKIIFLVIVCHVAAWRPKNEKDSIDLTALTPLPCIRSHKHLCTLSPS